MSESANWTSGMYEDHRQGWQTCPWYVAKADRHWLMDPGNNITGDYVAFDMSIVCDHGLNNFRVMKTASRVRRGQDLPWNTSNTADEARL